MKTTSAGTAPLRNETNCGTNLPLGVPGGTTRNGEIMVLNLGPLLAILFGLLILVFPKFLNYLVAIYLVLSGLVGLGVIALR
jgi:hypothetical protein